MLITHPPQIQEYAVRHGTRLRFICSSAVVNQAVTFQNLLDTMLIALSGTVVNDIFTQVKVRAIEAWANAVIGNAATVAIFFGGETVGAIGDQRLHTDTSMGIEPAHVKARPSARCQAAQFQPSSAAVAFYITCPAGTVVDAELTFVQAVDGAATTAQNASVSTTAGASYWRGLDGVAIAATKFPPMDGVISC